MYWETRMSTDTFWVFLQGAELNPHHTQDCPDRTVLLRTFSSEPASQQQAANIRLHPTIILQSRTQETLIQRGTLQHKRKKEKSHS